jgi:hypothetical protein
MPLVEVRRGRDVSVRRKPADHLPSSDFLPWTNGVDAPPEPRAIHGPPPIFGCDLGELTDVDHIVGSVENLSQRSTTLQRVDDGSCFRQAPYPAT